MTAKERAKDLYDKFQLYAHQEDWSEAPVPLKEIWEQEAKSKHENTINCCNVHIDDLVQFINDPDLINHFKEVKLELDNITYTVNG